MYGLAASIESYVKNKETNTKKLNQNNNKQQQQKQNNNNKPINQPYLQSTHTHTHT